MVLIVRFLEYSLEDTSVSLRKIYINELQLKLWSDNWCLFYCEEIGLDNLLFWRMNEEVFTKINML